MKKEISAVSTTALCYPRADPRVVASASPRLGASRSAAVRKLTPQTALGALVASLLGMTAGTATLRAASHPSRPSEPDRDFARFDDDRHAPAAGDADHSIELSRVALDVDVGERDLPTRVVLTGRGRVRSGVLSEDLDPRPFHSSLRPRS
jgi:hypothetical protein